MRQIKIPCISCDEAGKNNAVLTTCRQDDIMITVFVQGCQVCDWQAGKQYTSLIEYGDYPDEDLYRMVELLRELLYSSLPY